MTIAPSKFSQILTFFSKILLQKLPHYCILDYVIKCLYEEGVKMDITDVRIRKVTDEGKMKAIVSITFDNEFVVHDIKIIDGQNGLFVAMPSRQMSEGDFRDIAHPILSETRNKIKDAIFEAYEKAINE